MWNPIKLIADTQMLPESELRSFAVAHADKYGVDVDHLEDVWISNWHVDALLRDFESANFELCAQERTAQSAQRRR